MKKKAQESLTIMTNFVLPNQTNNLDTLFGGELLAMMDKACAISAGRHSESKVVTASVNHVSFNQPIPLGSVVVIEAKVSRAFTTSMEVYADCWIDNPISKTKVKANEAIYTLVAVDDNLNPIRVPELEPETQIEKQRYESALRRRQLSLVLSGKLKAKEATELKKIFED
ncbi:MAG: acyl-CoA thioesterase [Flavobacteriales bacterium]|nr:acyl-CoA thioesterase [Flavobacteriales bacterium]